MSKFTSANVLDAALNYIKNNVDQLNICSELPTTYEEATVAGEYRLAKISGLSAVSFTGPEDSATGRKLGIKELSTIGVTNAGLATHVALTSTVTSELIYVTTCAPQNLNIGNTAGTPLWYINFNGTN